MGTDWVGGSAALSAALAVLLDPGLAAPPPLLLLLPTAPLLWKPPSMGSCCSASATSCSSSCSGPPAPWLRLLLWLDVAAAAAPPDERELPLLRGWPGEAEADEPDGNRSASCPAPKHAVIMLALGVWVSDPASMSGRSGCACLLPALPACSPSALRAAQLRVRPTTRLPLPGPSSGARGGEGVLCACAWRAACSRSTRTSACSSASAGMYSV
mmetsp:Transcript_28761/g.73228  ORF Transcript_28761/g.73228 Transcript_28761/m.73228 type:complete len:213 (-) Transcript_28761:727-1365(-)